MRYFTEIADYQTYQGEEADFHFNYNANTGGGQSRLGGKFYDANGNLSTPIQLNGRVAVFAFAISGNIIQLSDPSVEYEVKPRDEGNTNMKLGVGSNHNPSEAIATFLMLPKPCGVKNACDINTSALSSNNYWLQSMWLDVDTSIEGKAIFKPKDCIICGGIKKEQGSARYFSIDFAKRFTDVINAANNNELDGEVLSCVKLFADIYKGEKPFVYDESAEAIKAVMKYLSSKYPEEYSGTLDPLAFICELSNVRKSPELKSEPRQKITYGAPGTGKSHKVDGLTDNQNVAKCVRTTFHPDSDYATFVGAYKPTMNGEKIAYEFRPQAFMDAYVKAWQEMAQPDSEGKVKSVVLVIEEINRGNCAQIFGDLFQLLDRGKNGYSTYPIDADTDLSTWLAKDDQLGQKLVGLAKPDDIKKASDWADILVGKKLALPSNLYIWATMNTSDQSLFPIDSAFKRRWDWEYVPIAKPDKSDDQNWKERKIEVGDSLFDWWEFLMAINGHIAKATESEDKQLGYFFVKADDATGYISAEQFANKVLFYLYGDVFKSYDLPKENCFKVGDKVLKFRDFFYTEKTEVGLSDGTKVEKKPGDVKLDIVAGFLKGLKWKEIVVTCEQKPVAAAATASETVATQGESTSGDDNAAATSGQ